MKDYSKNSFYTYKNELDGQIKYYIKIDGQKIEVSKEVYLACHNSYQKQLRDMRRDIKNGLISYDVQMCDGIPLLDQLSSTQTHIENNNINSLYEILRELEKQNREIIFDLFFYGKSEKELAKELGISQQAINKRKKKLLTKIKNKL